MWQSLEDLYRLEVLMPRSARPRQFAVPLTDDEFDIFTRLIDIRGQRKSSVLRNYILTYLSEAQSAPGTPVGLRERISHSVPVESR